MSRILKGASKTLVIAVVVVVVVIAGILLSYPQILSGAGGITQQTPAPGVSGITETAVEESEGAPSEGEEIGISESVSVEVTPSGPATHTVEMSSAGFSPNTLTVNAGDTVTFAAVGSGSYWPASAVHPTHTVYPGSSIDKCQTEERTTIFDACESLTDGESFSFTFNEVGEWKYHNHVNIAQTGTIVVQ